MTGLVVLIFRIILVAALYLFLGVALFSLWRQLSDKTQVGSATLNIPTITLEPREFNSPSRAFKNQKAITIGRNDGNDIHFEDIELSNHHAMLRYHHKQWWIEDIHSTNGTFINGDKIKDPTVLFTDDILRCGLKEWKVMIESQEKAR
jgi:pSer/pThr/pTyr-binding forkhead associated (FHA) protein